MDTRKSTPNNIVHLTAEMQPFGTESSIINEIQQLWPAGVTSDVVLGIGDDAAVLRSFSGAEEVLATVDQVVENQHFNRDSHPADALGQKLLVRGLSDVAAMGGRARWLLLTLILPKWVEEDWLKHFFEGMVSYCRTNDLQKVALAGGDLSAGRIFAASLTAVGSAPRGTALRRSGARPGDRLYVTGTLGGSALGFERIAAGAWDDRDPAVERHWRPSARLAAGEVLREAGATAAIDVTDGLSTDLARVAEASGVGFEIDFDALPRFPGASDQQLLHGGEEYELLVTVPPDAVLPESVGGAPVSAIGRAVKGAGLRLRRCREVSELRAQGFDHFEQPSWDDAS